MQTTITQQAKEILPTLLKFKKEISDLYQKKLNRLILYGSYARGDTHEFSDVDILLVLNDMESPYTEIGFTSDLTFNYFYDYDLYISLVPTTVERFDKGEISLYHNIKNEGIEL